MKISRKQLEEGIRKFLNEAAPDGYIQKKYRKTFRNMIAKASTGGNKNTPPYKTNLWDGWECRCPNEIDTMQI